MKFFPNTTGAYLTAYKDGAAPWTSATDVDLLVGTSSSYDFVSVAGYYGNNGLDGHTSWGCNLIGGFQTVNTELNKTYLDPYPALQKRMVAMHELGHALGLDHSSAGGYPVMAVSASDSYNHGTTSLTADDKAGMNYLY